MEILCAAAAVEAAAAAAAEVEDNTAAARDDCSATDGHGDAGDGGKAAVANDGEGNAVVGNHHRLCLRTRDIHNIRRCIHRLPPPPPPPTRLARFHSTATDYGVHVENEARPVFADAVDGVATVSALEVGRASLCTANTRHRDPKHLRRPWFPTAQMADTDVVTLGRSEDLAPPPPPPPPLVPPLFPVVLVLHRD